MKTSIALFQMLKHKENIGLSPRTIQVYSSILERFQTYLSDKHVKRITLEDIHSFLSRRKASMNTVSLESVAIRELFVFLKKKDIEALDPIKIDCYKKDPREMCFLEKEELVKMRNSINDIRTLAIFDMLYSTGMRISELTSLNKNDVKKEIRIMGKGSKTRLVFVSDIALESVKNYLSTRNDNDPALFVNRLRRKDYLLNKRLSNTSIETIIRQLARTAGIDKKVTPHTLRHSFASNMLYNGSDIRSIQQLLGHNSLQSTQVYTHITNRHLREQFNRYHK